ncbi:MAG: ATP-binding protein [Bacteroidales bacterium]|nr:ATP-binding protein [Bacteroidales bacterium]
MNTLQIPNKVEMLQVLQSFVVESAKVYNLPDNLLEKLKLISEEAFLQVIKNSFSPNEESSVKINIQADDFYFQLSFFDKGLPYDESLAREYHPVTDIDSFDAEGMELFLIRQYVDNVEWINHGHDGKEFRLSFEIPHRDIITILKNDTEQSEEKISSPDDVEIREFRESDAIKIARTIYRAYGYTYPNEDMYYPEKIVKLNASGELISVVCFDKKTEEVVGHYALERPGLGAVAESGQAVVAPGYRGLNLMGKMRDILESKAELLKLEGIMSQPVTSHIYSQKVNTSFGSHPCGISFGLVPQKLSFKQINQSLSQRESCMLYFKPFKQRNKTLFIPERHLEIIKKIYQELQIPFLEGVFAVPDRNEPGQVLSGYAAGWGFGEIVVKKPGSKNFTEVKRALYDLLFTLKADVIFLYVPLEERDLSELIELVEKEKFFFCGIVPSYLDGKDVIKFEYLNGSIDTSKIEIYGEEAKQIFSYILNEKERVLS